MQKCSRVIIWVLVAAIVLGVGVCVYIKWINPRDNSTPIEIQNAKPMPSATVTVTATTTSLNQ